MRTYWNPLDRGRLVERIEEVTPQSERVWGKMTAHQMICHLADAFRGVMGERPLGPRLGRERLLKWPALYLPVPWPHGYPAPRELDQVAGYGTPPVEFLRDREELLELMRRFTPAVMRSRLHPLWGRLTEWEWGRWAYRHTDHHLRQFGV